MISSRVTQNFISRVLSVKWSFTSLVQRSMTTVARRSSGKAAPASTSYSHKLLNMPQCSLSMSSKLLGCLSVDPSTKKKRRLCHKSPQFVILHLQPRCFEPVAVVHAVADARSTFFCATHKDGILCLSANSVTSFVFRVKRVGDIRLREWQAKRAGPLTSCAPATSPDNQVAVLLTLEVHKHPETPVSVTWFLAPTVISCKTLHVMSSTYCEIRSALLL